MEKTKGKIKVYVSLPITGRKRESVRAAAGEAAMRLSALGYAAVSPLDNGLEWDAPHEAHMRADFKALLGCGAVYFCEGYIGSKGCLAESMVASSCGMRCAYWCQDDEEVRAAVEGLYENAGAWVR